ncbi:MAG: Eco57I restriction-modification methylase domain-containing protein, partial [Bacteroidota bacterium]
KRILLNNIYGVDIDPQAVEVTKLSLLLKVLEGESEQTLATQLRLFQERALPDLGRNVQCGNSLIGPDFYQGRQMSLLEEDERYRLNVFDWPSAFPEIMREGGFDAVIGNPPYIRVRVFSESYPEQVDYLIAHYRCATHVWDIYLLFFERALSLTRQGGHFSFIVPVQTLHQPNCESLRKILLSETTIVAIADLSRLKVFQDAIVKNCILVCERGSHSDALIETFFPNSPSDLFNAPSGKWPQTAVMANPGYSLKMDLLTPKKYLCEKLISQSWQLDELCYVTFGLRSCAKGKGQGGKERLITTDPHLPNAKPYLEGRDIRRYEMTPTGRFVRYIPEEMYSPRTPLLFETKKIVSQSMLSRMRLIATLDDAG